MNETGQTVFPWEAHIPTETVRPSTTQARHSVLEGSERCVEELNIERTKKVPGEDGGVWLQFTHPL